MNEEIKQKWVEALRSGKYKQTSGVLYQSAAVFHGEEAGEECFCALGVLSDIIAPDLWDRAEFNYLENVERSLYLADTVTDKSGITESQQYSIVDRNDGHGLPFEEIATWIEENL